MQSNVKPKTLNRIDNEEEDLEDEMDRKINRLRTELEDVKMVKRQGKNSGRYKEDRQEKNKGKNKCEKCTNEYDKKRSVSKKTFRSNYL